MQFKNILKNRLYVFPPTEDLVLEDPLDLIQTIFKDTKKLNIPNKEQIELVDSNLNYDTYLIDFSDQPVCLKVSFDSECDLLEREFNLLNQLNGKISPQAIACNSVNYGNKIHYSISTFETLQSIKENAYSELFNNLDNFFINLDFLHDTPAPKQNFLWIENYIFKYLNFEKYFTKKSIFSIKNKYNFNLFKKIISEINIDINNLLKSDSLNKNDFCHGNLKPSNILNLDNQFKFINFENHFSGNKYFDIASLSINFQLNREIDKDFFQNYLSHKKINFTSMEWQSYKDCYNIILRRTFLEILINFLIEDVILSKRRPVKIFELTSLYCYNEENFQTIQVFKNNYKFINDIFSEIILGKAQNE
jgi:hypothetical protein